ncbi:PAS domain S-box protein [bacterium]|nr:PAS domain S-box protein [bacterium]
MNGINQYSLLEAMFAQSLDGIFFMMLDTPVHWDKDNPQDEVLDYVISHQRITATNPAFDAQYGAKANELLGRTPLDFFAHDVEQCRNVWRDFLNAGGLHVQTEERRLDGSLMWVEGDYLWIKNDDGAYIGHFGIQRDITERIETEQALRTTKARYEALFNQSNDAVYLLDLEGRHINANQRAADMLGYSMQELRTMSYVQTSAEQAASKRMLQRLLDGEKIPLYHRWFYKKSGERFPTEVNVELVRDGEDRPLYIQSIVRDVTEREALNVELAQRTAHAEVLNDIITASINVTELTPLFEMVLDKLSALLQVDGGIIWTPSIQIMRNVPPGTELIYARMTNETFPQRERFIVSDVLGVQTGNAELDEAAKHISQFGGRAVLLTSLKSHNVNIGTMVLYSTSPRSWKRQEIRLADTICQQIGAAVERLQLIEDLKASQKRYQVLSEMMADYACVYQMHVDGQMTLEWERGKSLVEISGHTLDEITAMGGPMSIVVSQDREKAALTWSRYAQPTETEFRIRHKDGQTRWLRRITQVDNSSEPAIVGHLYETITDITEQKEIQNQITALELESQRAQILSKFIRDASHEFRTPLSIIGLSAYALKRLSHEEKLLDRLTTIEKQVDSMNDLVSDLLTIARLDNKSALDSKPLNLRHIVLSEFESKRVTVDEKGLAFELEMPDDLPLIYGDGFHLNLAVRNIVDNAIRYTNHGRVTLRLFLEDGHIVIEVADTGIGMSPETQARIFERFFREDDARSERGFGLGLPVAQKVLERHNGFVSFESEPGVGSTFRLHVPTTSA